MATAASATPSPVTGTTTQPAVLGANDAGEPALSYTWAATGPAAVTITPNGTNAAKAATATFARAGAYAITATLRDAGNLTATSTVMVTVNATLTTLAVAPSTASVPVSTTQQFTATAYDRFAIALTSQPTKTWTVGGGGTISASGLFTAGTTTGGPYPVTATAGSATGTAQIVIAETEDPTPPTVAILSPADGAVIAGATTLAAEATDDLGVARVVFTIAGQALEASAPPWEVAWDATAFVDGQYAIETQAFDLAGNPSAPATITVEVRHATTGEVDEDEGAGGCGCGTGRGGPGGEGALVIVAIAALVSRRRRA